MDHKIYIKDAEEKLRKYSTMEETLKNLRKKLEKLKYSSSPKEITAVDFSRVGNGSSKRKDALEEFIEIKQLIKKINQLQGEQELISDVLEQIKNTNKENYDFICLRYFDNNSLQQTSELLGYSMNSHSTIYTIKDNALDNFIWFYYGE